MLAGAVCLLGLGAAPRPSRPSRRVEGVLPVAASTRQAKVPGDVAAALLRGAQPYFADPATLAAPATAFPGEDVVELYNLRYEQVMANGLSGVVVQRVFQIRDRDAANLFVLDDLWYDSSRNRFQLQSAEVLRGHQTLHGWDRGDLHPGESGNQPRHVALPELRPGDRVAVTYLLLPDTNSDWSVLDGHFLGNLFAFRDNYPTLRARYVLAARQPMAFNQAGVSPPQIGHDADGRLTWAWQAENQPAFFSQPDGPSLTDASAFVQVSGFDSWAALATWYGGLLAQRARLAPAFERHLLALAGSPEPMRARAVAVADHPLTLEQTRATVSRVWGALAERLEYRGNEAGVHAYVPAPVEQVFQSERGDCKDGALLLVTWLRAAGLEADLALVRTQSMGRLAPPDHGVAAATMAAFDHALVYVPATQQWIDTTAPDFLDTGLPSSDQNALALIVRAGQQALVRVPSAPPQANRTRRTISLTPAAAGWLRAEGDIRVQGADAPDLRQHYVNPAARRDEMASWLRMYFPTARVSSVSATGLAPSSPEVDLHFVALVPSGAFSAAWFHRHYATLLAAQAQRSTTLELPLRWEADESWTLNLGQGPAAPTCLGYRPDAPIHIAGSFGQLDIRTGCSGGRFTVASRVLQTAEQVAPGEYGRFRAFWQSVDENLNAAMLTPLNTPGRRTNLLEIALGR